MNVVLLPALASSLASAVADGLLCLEMPCLLGWAWSMAALMLVSAWLVQRWPAGGEVAIRFAPVAASAGAVVPRLAELAPQTRAAPARSDRTELAACLGMRAPPTTDMAASPERNRMPGQSLSSPHPTRSTGTPLASESSDRSGQPSPA